MEAGVLEPDFVRHMRTRPFELVGAPWIDAERFAAGMNALRLPGVYFRPAGFEPTFQKYARQSCGATAFSALTTWGRNP